MANEYLDDAKEWLSFAEADLGVAEHLNKTYHPKPLEIICFHCQQAAEKAVKSIIVLNGSQGGTPKKHDLFLFLEERHAEKAIDMANDFVGWAKLTMDETEDSNE